MQREGTTRRNLLALVGTGVALSTVGIASGADDEPPSVHATGASDVDATSAMLHAYLESWGCESGGELCIEYRRSTGTEWRVADCQVQDSEFEYFTEVTGLEPATTYEYRAHAAANDGDESYSDVVAFTTGDGDPPSVDSFEVTANDHDCGLLTASVTADWEVSDPEGYLDAVEIEYRTDDGVVDVWTGDLSGGTAAGSDTSDCGESNTEWEVTLTVWDTNGQAASETRTVSPGIL